VNSLKKQKTGRAGLAGKPELPGYLNLPKGVKTGEAG